MNEQATFACPDCHASSTISTADPEWHPIAHRDACPQEQLPLLERTFVVMRETAA